MKIVRKVRPVEIKRAFITAQVIRLSRKKRQRYLPELTREEFLEKLQRAKTAVSKMTEKKLDKIIAAEYPKRLNSYNNAMWYLAVVPTNEIGVWRRAGGLPSSWTCGNLMQTARYFMMGLANRSRRINARSKRAIPRIIKFIDYIKKEKALFPIVFASGTGTKGRKWCRGKVTGDIDDGCMRAIALALSGRKLLNIYFGRPKTKHP